MKDSIKDNLPNYYLIDLYDFIDFVLRAIIFKGHYKDYVYLFKNYAFYDLEFIKRYPKNEKETDPDMIQI